MVTEDDVRAIALALPGTTEEQWYQTPGYKVAERDFYGSGPRLRAAWLSLLLILARKRRC